MKTLITKNDNGVITKAYKPDVALINFCGDHGYELSEEEKRELIDILESSDSFNQFFNKIPIGYANHYSCPISKLNRQLCALSYNNYLMWDAESRSDGIVI